MSSKFDQIVADLCANGDLTEAQAKVLRNIYTEELAKHGDEDAAGRAVVKFLKRSPEERRQGYEMALTIVLDAVAKILAARKPVPIRLRLIQVLIGTVLGGVITATVFAFVYGGVYGLQALLGTTSGRVRVPLGLLLLPFMGAAFGGVLGWQFDWRVVPERSRRLLDTSAVLDRAWIAWCLLWTVGTVIAFTIFDPFDRRRYRYWREDDWLMLAFVWVGPIVGGWACAQLFRWVAAGRRE